MIPKDQMIVVYYDHYLELKTRIVYGKFTLDAKKRIIKSINEIYRAIGDDNDKKHRRLEIKDKTPKRK